ncbi:MAG: universal stress protein [Candidatus Obscuribacterales bacterium]|nr:universal stress protein [Candidatus Obscuribacterales bacterium]
MTDNNARIYVVAVGLDDSASSWKAFGEALQFASVKKAELHIVSIQETADASYSASEVLATDKTSREKLEKAQNKASIMAEEAGITATTEIVAGSSTAAMVDYVKTHDIDLLVIGDTGHSSIWGALLGTNAEKIVRHAKCSVMVVR